MIGLVIHIRCNLEVEMEDLPLICDCGCKETEERNVYKDDINGIFTTVEYDEYCKGCGKYLGHYSYGHWEY